MTDRVPFSSCFTEAWPRRLKLGFFVVMSVVGLAARIVCVGTSQESLVRAVPDDAFYYFTTAQNIVAGHGSALDGIHPANGYHPLWMGVLLPIAWLVRDPVSFVRVVIGFGILLNALSAFLLWRAARRLSEGDFLPCLAVALYFLSPQSIASSVNGLETSLATLIFMLLLDLVLRSNKGGTAGFSSASGLGLLLGLLFLARTDTVFYAGAFLVARVGMCPAGKRLGYAAAACVVALAVTVPWLLWNALHFHALVQASGWAVPYVMHELFRLQGHGMAGMLHESTRILGSFVVWGLGSCIGLPRHLSFVYPVAVVVALGTLAWRWPALDDSRRKTVAVIVLLMAAGAALVWVHAFLRWYPRSWYFDQMMPLSALLAVQALALLKLPQSEAHGRSDSAGRRVAWIGPVVVVLLVGSADLAYAAYSLRKGMNPHQAEMLEAGLWLKNHTDKSERVGAFNAGIVSFFSGRPTVNLDGVMNNEALEAIRGKQLFAFMRRSQVRYMADFEPFMLNWYAPFLGDEDGLKTKVVKRFNLAGPPWEKSHVVIRELDWSP